MKEGDSNGYQYQRAGLYRSNRSGLSWASRFDDASYEAKHLVIAFDFADEVAIDKRTDIGG